MDTVGREVGRDRGRILNLNLYNVFVSDVPRSNSILELTINSRSFFLLPWEA